MGFHHYSVSEQARLNREWEEWEEPRREAERECYVMAQELRDHTAHLKQLVSAILAIEAEEA